MLRLLPLTIALFVLTAGCTSSGSGVPAQSSATSAPPPVVDATEGSITGTVVDEEHRAVPDVRVAILTLDQETRTDAAGAFTFNGLETGTYQIYFERLGYVSTAKKADVVAGEVTNLNVVLAPLVIGNEPYQMTDQRTFYFNFAWYYVSRAVPIVNQSSLNQQTCDPCVFHIPLQPGPKAVLSETFWVRSIPQPGFNENIEPFYCIDWEISCTVDGQLVDRKNMGSRDRYPWSASGSKALAKIDLLRLEVLAGFPGVMVQQKGDIWTSFAYLDEFPDEFTALPPQ